MRTRSSAASAIGCGERSSSPTRRLSARSSSARASSPSFFACPTWRDSSLTVARRDSKRVWLARHCRVGLDHRVHLGRLDTAPRQCGFDCVGVVAQGPDIDHLGAKVACDAVPALQVTGLTVRYGPVGTPRRRRRSAPRRRTRARWSWYWARTAPARPRRWRAWRDTAGRSAARCASSVSIPSPTTHALTGHIGVMLQRGGVYPMLGPRRALDLFAGYYPDPVPTDELLELVGLRAVATHALAPPLRRGAAAALLGLGVDRAARGGLPRRTDRRRRPRGTRRHPRRRGRAEGERGLHPPHHPRAGRSGAGGGSHRDHVGRPHRAGGNAARAPHADPGTVGSAKTGPAAVTLTFGAPPGLDVERAGGRSRHRDERHGDRARPLPPRGRQHGVDSPGRHGGRRHVPRRARRGPDRPGRGPDARGGLLRSRRRASPQRGRTTSTSNDADRQARGDDLADRRARDDRHLDAYRPDRPPAAAPLRRTGSGSGCARSRRKPARRST